MDVRIIGGWRIPADDEAKTTQVPELRIDFRLSLNAWRDMTGWIRAGTRERSAEHETGGLLFGELDETLGIAWVTNVSGPR